MPGGGTPECVNPMSPVEGVYTVARQRRVRVLTFKLRDYHRALSLLKWHRKPFEIRSPRRALATLPSSAMFGLVFWSVLLRA